MTGLVRYLRHACALLAFAFAVPPALPVARAQQAAPDTLQRIQARGYFALGHRESSVPFSYYDQHGEVVGYSHDLSLQVVEAVRRHLGRPDLPVRLVPITPQDRIDRILAGDIDLECGSTTHNSQRARLATFSNTIFVIGTRLLTRRDSGIHDFSDLAGRRTVTTAGTTSADLLHRINQEKNLRTTILIAPDHAESFAALENGTADAFMMDDALLYGEIVKAEQPETWVVTGTPQSFEAYGCMMRRGDTAFKRLVDRTLADLMASHEAERLYRKWFMSPLPGYGTNLNFPLSDAMRALYRAPNDRPLQ